MRVLIANDGSAGSARAVALASAIAWPPGSHLRVVGAIPPMPVAASWTGGFPVSPPDLAGQMASHIESETRAAVERLRSPDRFVDGVTIAGRPATVILDAARAYEADLVLVGSRGHGTLADLVLGSVSAEVTDHAGCPVLVARRPTIERVLLATDDSDSSRAAEEVVAHWPILVGAPVHVLSVAETVEPWHTGIAPTLYREVLEGYAHDLAQARQDRARGAEASAERLAESGRDVSVDVRVGHAAHEIIAAAAEWQADLIVLGSRGQTGLTRLLLGSVARSVVHGTSASVLIVRDAVDMRVARRTTAGARTELVDAGAARNR